MRIGIDARELCGRPTGVGRYLLGLLGSWAAPLHTDRHEFVLYAPEDLHLAFNSRSFFTRTVPGPRDTWWEQRRLPSFAARDGLDVLFCPAYSAPLSMTVPIVVTMHDISFVAHPEWFAPREGFRRRWLARAAARKAAALVTVSQFSKREIVDRLNVPAAMVHVIPEGVTRFSERSLASPDVPRVLYVGSVFNRRHVPDLIRAFAPIARAHPAAALDIVGDDRTYPRQDLARLIDAEGLPEQVHWKRYVPDEELRSLFGSARAFAFLSEYEGFGLTPLEALASGVPPVLLDTPVAREICGEAGLYVARDDVRGTTQALNALLFDDAKRAPLLAAAPATLAQYSWPKAAEQTLALLESVSKGSR